MAADEAHVKMTADDAEAQRMWSRQLAAVERLDKKIDQMGTRMSAGSQTAASSLAKYVAGLMTADRAISMIVSGLQDWARLQEQIRLDRAKATLSRSETFSKFVVQSEIAQIKDPAQRAKETASAKKIINAAALEAGVSPEQADQAATQLVTSAGFDRQMVLGGGLQKFLKATTAAAVVGKEVDPSSVAKNVALFMSANRMEANEKNFGEVLLAIHQARKAGNLEFEDMEHLAPDIGVIKSAGRVDWRRQLALQNMLQDESNARLASNTFRTATERLATASVNPTAIAALGKIGLKPTDVDFVPDKAGGAPELFEDVMERIRDGLEKMPEAGRAGVIKDIFGAEGSRAATRFLIPDMREQLQERMAAQTDEAALQRDFDEASKNAAANMRRAEARGAIADDVPGGAMSEILRKELETSTKQAVREGKMTGFQQLGFMKAYQQGQDYLGLSPERAAYGAAISANVNPLDPRTSLDFSQNVGLVREAVKRAGGDETAAGRLTEPGGFSRTLENFLSPRSMREWGNAILGDKVVAPDERFRERTQAAPGEGAAASRPVEDRMASALDEIKTDMKALVAINREPQKISVETPGRKTPAKKAVDRYVG